MSAFTVDLVAGTYQYFISPLGTVNNWQDCSGGNRYWFKITGTIGACCNGTSCSAVVPASCSGSFKGAGTLCGTVDNPMACCPANFNQVGGLSVQDIFDFLAVYFAGDPRADFNGVGGVSVQDIFDFLAAYFAGCL